ncbi:MAG: anti-sigma factor, partial [Thermodesulfovibrionales bacterium]
MDCGKIRKDLHAYLNEMVNSEEKARIEGHLASCPDCRIALEELKQTVQLLENLDEVEPPAWLTQRVMARVRAENAGKEGFLSRLFGWIPMNLPATAVATLVIAVTAVVLMKSMEPKLQETVQTTVSEQPLAPAQGSIPQQAGPEKTDKGGARPGDQAAREEALKTQALLQKSLPAAQKMPDDRPATVPPVATVLAPSGKLMPERNPGTAMKKPADAGEGTSEDRTAPSRENKTLSRQQAPAALQAAPAAPAGSSAPKPAEVLPEQGTARGRAVLKDGLQAEQDRPPAKAREERA